MSTKPIIQFHNVRKRFKLADTQQRGLIETLTKRADPANVLWAVDDVSFEVQRGESVGLIGHNGSGKSTLLKLATQILQPTSGSIYVDGRISPLLELGAGFHPDLTGRENIYLNGSVLGLSNPEIDARLEDIIAFSELEKFIDVPVKHYSSGMYMRLGFSVAVHCDPDVLLVDEILAVGDRAYQRKCLDRIALLKKQGITIMMVSHSLDTLLKLCDSIVWMDQGEMRAKGAPQPTIARYVTYMNERIAQQGGIGDYVFNRHGTQEAEFTKVRFLDAAGTPQTVFQKGDSLTIEMQYTAHREIKDPEFGIAIDRDDGIRITAPNNRAAQQFIPVISGSGIVRYHVPTLRLHPADYLLTVAIHDAQSPIAYDAHLQAYRFTVKDRSSVIHDGVTDLQASWIYEPQLEAA